MNYELAKQLKEAGFNNIHFFCDEPHDCRVDREDCKPRILSAPTLSELIEACGDRFWSLSKTRFEQYTWSAHSSSDQWDTEISHGKTPEEAVAKLWLELNKK